jgi:MoaA/NifB/PqqE/SkfB family radical SAM enzyme
VSANQVPSVHRDPRRNVEINLGKVCNNKCVFCLDGMPSKEDHAFMPFDTLQAELARWRSEGHASVGFLGGEPTTHPQIVAAVAFAKKVGFTRVTLATNAMMLRREEFLDDLIRAGLTRVTVSMHGHTAELEDSLTMVPGGFLKKCTALRHLVQRRNANLLRDGVSVNVVLNGWNYRYLLPMMQFFYDEMGLEDLRVNFVRPEGYAEDNADLVPTFTGVIPLLVRAIALNERRFRRVFTFGGIPLCVLPAPLLRDRALLERYAGDIYRDLSTDCSIRSDTEEEDGVAHHDGGRSRFNWQDRKRFDLKYHMPVCRGCALTEVCEGVWRGYLDIYGEDEFAALIARPTGIDRERPAMKVAPEARPLERRRRYHRRLLVLPADA